MTNNRPATGPAPLREARQLIADCRALCDAGAPSTVVDNALYRAGLADHYTTTDSPLGPVYIAWSAEGMTLAMRALDAAIFTREAREILGRSVTPGDPPERIARGARAWLAGERSDDLRFDLRQLTPFERAVLMKTREIPRGEVRPYGWIAREIGHPGATRAVGTALAHNPVPLFIPCHRVVRSDGHIGRYSMGGEGAKRVVLTYEGVNVDEIERLADAGVRFIGRRAERYYCYPTCGEMMNLSAGERRDFSDAARAEAEGYHACQTCRPPTARRAS
jgi:O-6-methylguanine DNA methyltransferase